MALVAGVYAAGVSGQVATNTTPEEEYRKLIRINEDIQPLGETPFGENVSLYDGRLSFSATDISLTGTGPAIQINRTFQVEAFGDRDRLKENAFGDWDMEVPRITTIAATQQNVQGWMVLGPNPKQICTHFGPPPGVNGVPNDAYRHSWQPQDWWHGYQLIVPGVGSQDLLARSDNYTVTPQVGSTLFPAITKQNWQVGCVAQAVNDMSREAFLVVSPDGGQYRFDYLAKRWASPISRPIDTFSIGGRFANSARVSVDGTFRPMAAAETDDLYREENAMLLTRVTDRFGNWVRYDYDGTFTGKLLAVEASDGRKVNFTYDGSSKRVHSITVQAASASPRTWTYNYAIGDFGIPTLISINQPDNSSWQFNLAAISAQSAPNFVNSDSGLCSMLSPPTNLQEYTGTITHPSGLVGTFVVKPTRRGRSYVSKTCFGGMVGVPDSGSALMPNAWYVTAAVSKTFTGSGMPARRWDFGLSPSNESWWENCSAGCEATVWTDVTAPDGSTTRSVFSNRFDKTESRLLSTNVYAGAVGSTLIRAEWDEYAEPTQGPFPPFVGSELQKRVNEEQTERWTPVRKHVVQQDGNTFVSEVAEFDIFAQPVRTVRSNNIPDQVARDERTDLLNDTPHWVLGLPQRTYSYTTGEEVSRNVYDPNSLTLTERYRFGRKVMGYSFNGQGLLGSFTDGNGKTTSLSNYKRGIPQSISYPDGTSQSITVDDLGQIASVTNQASATTSYGYDAVGRLARIDYPAGDSVAWAPKTFQYVYVGAERGVNGPHWVRVVYQGNKFQRTDFDAMLRPVMSGSARTSDQAFYVSERTDYDWKGRKTFQSYPVDGAVDLPGIVAGVATGYDVLGRQTSSVQSSELGNLTTTTQYLSGAGKRVTDPKGNQITSWFQVFDQPAYDNVVKVEAPEGVLQTITRDVYGNPLSIAQGGITKTMTYDMEHRLCRTWEPESGSEIMAYDGASNLTWSASGASFNGAGCGQDQVAATARTVRAYDAMNRVTSVVYPAGTQPSTFTYDPIGNPATATSGTVSWTYGRNKLGLLTAEVLAVDGWSWALGYGYDANAALSTILYPDGEILSYNPDALGRPTTAGGYAAGLAYFPDGDMKSYSLGSGGSYVAQKNGRNLLSNFTYGKAGVPSLSEDFGYDANGNVLQITDIAGNNQRTKMMGYDGLNRLLSATASNLWGTESYTYDTLNNIRTLSNSSGTSTYNYDGSNLLASITNGATALHTFNYDARGNTVGKDGQLLNFDQANRLTSMPGKGDYVYDAAGRRVKKVTLAGTTYYAYNSAGQLMWEMDLATRLGSEYVYLGKKLIAKSTENIDILKPNQVRTSLAILGVPQLSPDGTTIDVMLDIVNNGTRTLTANSQYPVQMGYHLVADTGTPMQVEAGVNLPADIPVGGHGTITMRVAAPAVLGTGKRIRFSLMQVGVGWFQDWPNNGTVDAGPYSACPTSGTGNLCNNVTGLIRDQVNVALTITSAPSLSADGQNVLTTIDIANNGKVTLASAAPHPVNLGNHIIDAAGTSVQFDVARQGIPEIAPGQHAAVTISTPSATLLGSNRRVQFEPVQEGIAWFQSFGFTPLVAGPYVTLGGSTSSTNGSFALSWQPIAGATSYNLRESFNGGAWTNVSGSTATSWPATGRATGTYTYQVQACASGGCAPFGPGWNVSVLLPPPAPATATASAPIPGPVTLVWSASATATRYVVIQQVNGGAWTTVYDGAATSAVFGTPVSGTYQYQVQACNSSGCSGYRLSNAAGITLPPASAPGIAGGGTSINGAYAISWNGVAGATAYNLIESANGGGWQQVQFNAAGSWSTGGKPNGTYVYQVQACNAGGCGPWSGQAVVVVALPPVTPSGVSGGRTGPGYKRQYEIHWNAVATTTNYQIERTIPGVGTDYQDAGATPSSIFIEDTGEVIGQISMRVRACNPSGCSPWSDYVYASF
jgi:YD repeat-containing protein